MSDTLALDPEIEGLLRELTTDPRSTLLRVPRRGVLRTFFEQDTTAVSEHATGLLAAERELLHAHREALAKHVREACVMKLFSSPLCAKRLFRYETATTAHQIPNATRWRHDLRAERRRSSTPRAFRDVELLDRCLEPDEFSTVTVTELAAASLRLQPTAQARIYAAQEVIFLGDSKRGLQLLTRVGTAVGPPAITASIACNQGAALSDLGHDDLARESYARAVAIADPPLSGLVFWLAYSLRTQRRDDALAAAQLLDHLATPSHGSVREVIRSLSVQRSEQACMLSDASQALARSTRERAETTSSMVIDALLQ